MDSVRGRIINRLRRKVDQAEREVEVEVLDNDEDTAPTPTVQELRRRRQNGDVKLNDHLDAVENGLGLYIGESPVLPDKVNPSIPDNVWCSLQQSGKLAAAHLQLILSDRKFPLLAMKDQRALIELALARAYGSVDGSVRKNLHVFVNPEDAQGFNALADMARKSQKFLPEFSKTRGVSPSKGELPDEDGGD